MSNYRKRYKGKRIIFNKEHINRISRNNRSNYFIIIIDYRNYDWIAKTYQSEEDEVFIEDENENSATSSEHQDRIQEGNDLIT